MSELVTLTHRDGVAVITIENPPVNALSPGVPEGILAHVQTAGADPAVQSIVIIGGGRTFIAGADIREFGKMTSGQRPRLSLTAGLIGVEDCPKPVVMAIHGTAFGGGLEVAMSGHYRVAVASAQVGQPECKLGIIPGAAGTQRLPRLAGIQKAIEMCAYGEPIKAAEALQFGIIDQIVEGDLLDGAIAFAKQQTAIRKTRDLTDKLKAEPGVFDAARKEAKKTKRGQIAPVAAIDAVEAATMMNFEDGCKKEAELFQKCLFDNQSKSLIHAFFGERAVAKIPGIDKDTPMYDIKSAAVIGAGTMGGGIAMNYANAGIPVLIKETTREGLDKGMAIIARNYSNSVKKGRFSQDVMDQRMALITPQLTYEGFEKVDIIVEAVFEGMALKKEIFSALDGIAKAACILASNTSTLSIDEIAAATKRPEMVIGHHFFSPANVMRLLEIVKGAKTSKSVIATSMALAKKLSKVGVLAGNCRGFIGNRMVDPYGREAVFLTEEGAAPEQIDGALYEWGMAMGPLAMGDLAGLDVGWRIRKEYAHLRDPKRRYAKISDMLCEMGRYGQKTGSGWYKYDENRRPTPDPLVTELIEKAAAESGITRRTISNEEIIERTIYALVNEGAKILEEGFALRAVDIDIVYLMGYGFPAWRGGPMCYADTVGLKKVYDRVCEFEKAHGDFWAPAPLLKQLAEAGSSFKEWDKQKESALASA